MIFNDTTTLNGAIQKCEETLFGSNYGAISGNPTQLLKFTNLINRGLDKTKAIIFAADSTWEDDDPNYTTRNDETTDLAEGESRYELDPSHLIIDGFEVMGLDGKYRTLKKISDRDLQAIGVSEDAYATPSGQPEDYDLIGNVVRILPAPTSSAVTLTNGLKIKFKRESSYFVSTDTDKEMGIPRTFHDIPCLFASNEYAADNSMTDKLKETDFLLQKRTAELKDHFATRNKGEAQVITSETINSI